MTTTDQLVVASTTISGEPLYFSHSCPPWCQGHLLWELPEPTTHFSSEIGLDDIPAAVSLEPGGSDRRADYLIVVAGQEPGGAPMVRITGGLRLHDLRLTPAAAWELRDRLSAILAKLATAAVGFD